MDHVCHARKPAAEIDLDHQVRTCLTAEHRACPYYAEPPEPTPPPAPAVPESEEDEIGPQPRRFPLLAILMWVGAVGAVALMAVVFNLSTRASQPAPTSTAVLLLSLAPTATATATPTVAEALPSPTFEFAEATATPTPFPGGAVFTLSPASDAAGWVASDEAAGNHMGDSYLYTGLFDGVIYHGTFQIDLSAVARGATIHAATLELTGLDGRRLGGAGVWEVRLLAPEADGEWKDASYQDVHNAQVEWTLTPAMNADSLAAGQVNSFALDPPILEALQARLMNEQYTVSFRIDGPFTGGNDVFAWDSGYGAATQGQKPRLVLNVGAPPKTPVPSGTPPFVVVTSTPTPANVVTAAALAGTATAVVRRQGQPTPTSLYQWTATPPLIVTNTPTPGNQATAEFLGVEATAVALTTGTFTPTPVHLLTATITPQAIPAAELTPTPTPLLPTPIPGVPAELVGRIAFRSDRAGGVQPWVMGADGSDVSLLTADWPYEVTGIRDSLSPDGSLRVYAGTYDGRPAILVQPVTWTGEGQHVGRGRPIVVAAQGQVSEPAWSPAGKRIVFVGNTAGGTNLYLVNSDGTGLRQLTNEGRLPVSHPSFSGDGKQVVYARSDRDGRRQVWIVDLNGQRRRNLSKNDYDEWDPVWLK